MEKETEKEVEKFGIGLALIAGGYFFIVKPVMDKLLNKSPEDQKIDDQAKLPDDQNPFSPNFGIQYATANDPDHLDYATQSFAFIKNNWSDPSYQGTDGVHAALPYIYYATQIYDAIGAYVIDPDIVINAFNSMTSQYEVCQMAQYFNYAYNKDLLSFLRHGKSFFSFLDEGIPADDLSQIIDHINTLPVFDPGQLIM